jgi:NAD(P)H-quinone oxidoreductase subunit 6
MTIELAIFLSISAITIGFGLVVAFSRNIMYAAFALLGVFSGVLGLYIMLSADFVAIIQLIVYIGGILVLILFAVMLTTKIGERKLTNRIMAPAAAVAGVTAIGIILWHVIVCNPFFKSQTVAEVAPTTSAIGNLLLKDYLLPFEIVSLLLVLVLVGAVVLARRGVK